MQFNPKKEIYPSWSHGPKLIFLLYLTQKKICFGPGDHNGYFSVRSLRIEKTPRLANKIEEWFILWVNP